MGREASPKKAEIQKNSESQRGNDMSKAIRKARNAFAIGASLYRELALSAFTLVRERNTDRAFEGL